MNYPFATIEMKNNSAILKISSIEDAKSRIASLAASLPENEKAQFLHRESLFCSSLKDAKTILLTLNQMK
jgi:hypothetical protein